MHKVSPPLLTAPRPRTSRKKTHLLALSIIIVTTTILFLTMKHQYLYLLSSLSGALAIPMWTFDSSPVLRFDRNGVFGITVFEDLHFGEGEDNPPQMGWGPISDVKTIKVMNTILDIEHPNLVVLNGDLITGENTHLHNSTTYLDQIVGPLTARHIPWASAYGNHDHQINLDTAKLLERERRVGAGLSLTKDMLGNRAAGTSNYYLEVFGRRGGRVPEMLLWFFDSRGGMEFQQRGPDGKSVQQGGFVHTAAVEWFELKNAELRLKYGRSIPSLVFVHIPVYAMAAFQKGGVHEHREPGINDDDPLSPQGIGPGGKYTGDDVPFMKALVETKGIMGVFSGHDHGNDWCYRWDEKLPGMTVKGNGVPFCFGRHTGYGGYGKWTRGSRQIFVREGMMGKGVESWIRLEDGGESGRVVLNGTFGRDWYPKVKKSFSS